MNPADSYLNVGLKNLSDNNHDLCRSFKDVIKACNEVCGYKKNRKCNVNTWWWNCGVKDEKEKKHIKK